jgi:hypothetical protein
VLEEGKDQNAGRSHSIITDNSSSARVGKLTFLGTTLIIQTSIWDEIKNRPMSRNALLSSGAEFFCLSGWYPKILN